MKVAACLVASFALVGSVLGRPSHHKKSEKSKYSDVDILNYALTLEHLEDTFYAGGIAKFTADDFSKAGFDPVFYQNLKEIAYDEKTHVSFLTGAIKAAGGTPVAACTYNFGYTDVASFLATASVLEGVGVTAYIGAAGFISSKTYLTAAGSILTIEARHSAYLRAAALKQRPFPQAFDVPLDFNEVYSLAAPFIVSCPKSNPSFLDLKAFPAITVTSKGTVLTGGSVSFTIKSMSYKGTVYAAFVTVTGPVWAPLSVKDGVYTATIPAGVHGQSYLVVTKSKTAATDDVIVAGPAIVEISGTDGVPGSA